MRFCIGVLLLLLGVTAPAAHADKFTEMRPKILSAAGGASKETFCKLSAMRVVFSDTGDVLGVSLQHRIHRECEDSVREGKIGAWNKALEETVGMAYDQWIAGLWQGGKRIDEAFVKRIFSDLKASEARYAHFMKRIGAESKEHIDVKNACKASAIWSAIDKKKNPDLLSGMNVQVIGANGKQKSPGEMPKDAKSLYRQCLDSYKGHTPKQLAEVEKKILPVNVPETVESIVAGEEANSVAKIDKWIKELE